MSDNTTYLTTNYPNPLASRSEKKTDKYGLSYAQFMYYNFYKLSPILNEKLARLKNCRKYAEGLQSIADVRTRMGAKNTAYLNLDIQPVNYISKIVDIIVSVLMEQHYNVDITAIDPESRLIEENLRKKIDAAIFLKKNAPDLERKTGIPLAPPGMKIPEDDDEQDMYHAMNGKQGVSLAIEEAMTWVLNNNDFELEVRKKILRDLVVLKSAAVMRYYDENYNIRSKYVDFVDLLYPYSKTDTFKNIPYIGLMESMTIEELGQIAVNPDGTPKYTEKELQEIAKAFAGRNNNPAWNNSWGMSYEGYYANSALIKPYYNFNIAVLRFWFLAISSETAVKTFKNDKEYMDWKAKAPDDMSAGNKEVVGDKVKQWRYEGYWIPNSKYIFNYKESDNIPREKIQGGYSPTTMLPIDVICPEIFDMENKSIVEKAIQPENQLNLIEQKIQQFLIKAAPPGWAINQAALEEVKMGKGNDPNMTPDQQYDMWTQTGSIMYYAVDAQGNPLNANPINPLPNGLGQGFADLLRARQLEVQKINDVMGFNDAMNAQLPSSDVPVGTQQMARQATSNSLKSIYTAHVQLLQKHFKGLFLMIQDSIKYNEKAFIEAIGQGAVSEIDMFRKIPYATMGLKIELAPNEQERAEVLQMLNMDVQNQVLTSSDVIRVHAALKSNPKLAAQLLVQLENKNRKAAQDAKTQDIQMNAQSQQQSAQMASQMKQQELQLEAQSAIQKLQAEYQLKTTFEKQLFDQQMELQKLKNEGIITVAEVGKDGKVNVQQAANQGKVLEAQVAAQSKENVENIKHQSSVANQQLSHQAALHQVAFENAIAPPPTPAAK